MLTSMRQDLTAAVKSRDRVAVAALRSALAAVDNASAVDPTTAVALTAVGEVERRRLSSTDVQAIVVAEVDERVTAAADYERVGRADHAERLRAEAGVLDRYLTDEPT